MSAQSVRMAGSHPVLSLWKLRLSDACGEGNRVDLCRLAVRSLQKHGDAKSAGTALPLPLFLKTKGVLACDKAEACSP